jgi:hypothetical protein
VKLGFSFVPKAEPANGDRNLMIIWNWSNEKNWLQRV